MSKLLQNCWPILVAAAACIFVSYQFDWASVFDVIADLPILFIVFILSGASIAMFAICAVRWIAISNLPWTIGSATRAYCYVSFAIGLSMITPFQLGELLKVKLAERSGLRTANSAVNLALERVLDLAAILAMGTGGFLFVQTGLSFIPILAMIAIMALSILAPAMLPKAVDCLPESRLRRLLKSLRMQPISSKGLAVVGIATIVKWSLTLFVWLFLMKIVDIQLSIWEGLLLVGSVTAASIASMVPGGVGIQEVSVRAVLVGMGVDPTQAEGGAIILRLFTPVMFFLGLLHLPLMGSEKERNKFSV